MNVNRSEKVSGRVDLRKFHGIIPKIRKRAIERFGRPLSNGAVIKLIVRENPEMLEIVLDEMEKHVDEKKKAIELGDKIFLKMQDVDKERQSVLSLREKRQKKRGENV